MRPAADTMSSRHREEPIMKKTVIAASLSILFAFLTAFSLLAGAYQRSNTRRQELARRDQVAQVEQARLDQVEIKAWENLFEDSFPVPFPPDPGLNGGVIRERRNEGSLVTFHGDLNWRQAEVSGLALAFQAVGRTHCIGSSAAMFLRNRPRQACQPGLHSPEILRGASLEFGPSGTNRDGSQVYTLRVSWPRRPPPAH
jgi:hypothetical protein